MCAVCRRLFCAEGREENRSWPWGSLLSVLLLFVLGLVVSGCGRSSFVGRQYDDFTAYYNKFYNAEAAFEKRVESIRETDESIDRTQYLSLFLEPAEGSDEAFETVIQKSADVLREHPNSKWVDDALLMIGRSYYYQENYVGAAQKFREVIELGSGREGAARFWLARTLITNERYEAADEALSEGLSSDRDGGTWMSHMRMARGELLARQEQWEGAEEALSEGLEGDLPDRLAARGAFLLGQVRQTLGNADGARQAYQAVLDHDPRYALAFAARLSDVELQGRHGDSDEALDRLQDLEQDDKNYEMRGQLALVRARILRDTGRPDAARRVLRTTMYGEEAPSGASRGRLQYELATLYRDAYEDFSAAAAHFDTAQTSVGQGEGATGEGRRLPTAPADVEAQADQFRDLAEQAREVTRLDSLLRLGRMSEEELQSFVADLRERRREERENERARQDDAAGGAGQQFGQGGAREVEKRQESAPATETRGSDAGFLFHNDPARVQQGQQQFRQTWGNRGRVDNWRRRAAIRRTQTAEAEEGETTGTDTPNEGGSGPGGGAAGGVGIDLSAVPRDSARQAEMEAERAVARYELANALFLAAQRPDSAATWYQRVIEEDDEYPVADRARYALAEVYRAEGDTAAARKAYRQVIESAPRSSLAARARDQLGRSSRDSEEGVAQADTAYARAYETWQAGRLDSAFTRMLDLAHRYPETPAAPRALLASSIIYWRQMQAGASVPPPDSLRRRLPALDSLVADRLERGSSATATDDEQPGRPASPPDSAAAVSPETDSTGMNVDTAEAEAMPSDTIAAGPDTADAAASPADRAAPLTADDVPADSGRGNERDAEGGPAPAADSPAEEVRGADSTRTARRPWMLVVASLAQDTSAQDALSRYRSRWANTGMPVRLCQHENRYRVGLGRFASEEEAQAAKKKWASRLPDAVWTHSCVSGREEPPVVADTVVVADTSTAASPDSAVSAPSPRERYASLDAMLSYLTHQYPEAPQAARAESILELVQERREADSTAARTASGEAKQTGPPADSARAASSDSDRSPARSEPRQSGTTGTDSTTTSRRPLPAPDSAAVDSTAPASQPRSEEE